MMSPYLYAIIDPSYVADADEAVDVTRAVLRGGASVVQLRDKTSTTRQMLALAERLQAACAGHNSTFIVNDRLDVALACGADGVHLGPDDLPVAQAREVVGDDFIIGGSAGTPQVARNLADEGADYLGVGAIFEARQSKPDASPARGVEAIAAVVAEVDIPVVAIGGINISNAAEVVAQGASGVAVIRALLDVDDPGEAARRLVEVLNSEAQPEP